MQGITKLITCFWYFLVLMFHVLLSCGVNLHSLLRFDERKIIGILSLICNQLMGFYILNKKTKPFLFSVLNILNSI